jgi:regulator of protease activity HflC (stomatin/prohibitin superfamily)
MSLFERLPKPALPEGGLPVGKLAYLAVLGLLILGAIMLSSQLVSNVRKGHYEVRQSWVTGQVSAKMDPGWWIKLGTIQDWPKAETYYFTRGQDSRYDSKEDHSIVVQFNEGSECNISGTCRVILPKSEKAAVELTTVHGYQSWEDLLNKLIQPQVRKALIITANQMSARESYSDKRNDFIFLTSDQLIGGLYAFDEVERDVLDEMTGKKVKRLVKLVKRSPDGAIVRSENPFAPLGIRVENFEVKVFHYSDKVKQQIEKQQQAYMDIQTAIATAQLAKQKEMTAEAEGRANVATARYQQETEKVREVVKAQKDKEVAEMRGRQDLEVAKLNAQSAEQRKAADILVAQGEAEAKRLKREADNYEAMKIDAAVAIHKAWADAYSKRRVPLVSGSGAEDSKSGETPSGSGIAGQKGLVDLLILKSLGLDLKLDEAGGGRSVHAPQPAPQQPQQPPRPAPPPQPR